MFVDEMSETVARLRAPVCVGLDPMLEYIPASFLVAAGTGPDADGVMSAEVASLVAERYCKFVIDAVSGLVGIVKPQVAHFELFGSCGIAALERTIRFAKDRGMLVILDAKRGDIGSTSDAYARAYLARRPPGGAEIDALTVAPYLGRDSLQPFFRRANEWGKGIFVCARTSNPEAGTIQDLLGEDGRRVYEVVADFVNEQCEDAGPSDSGYCNCGLVVGATAGSHVSALRKRCPRAFFLVPGVGAQGGSFETVAECFDRRGSGAIVSVSRAIMYPDRFGPCDEVTADTIRAAAQAVIDSVRAVCYRGAERVIS